MDLLKRHRNGQNSRAVIGVLRRAADAITNLAHENSSIKSRVRYGFWAKLNGRVLPSSFILTLPFQYALRVEGGIPPLVELLEFIDTKVQRAAAGALRTLAFKNDENKNQVDPYCRIVIFVLEFLLNVF